MSLYETHNALIFVLKFRWTSLLLQLREGGRKGGRESEQEEGEERRGWKEEAIHKSSGREGPSLIV